MDRELLPRDGPGWMALGERVAGKRPSQAAFFDFEFWLYGAMATAVRHFETGFDPFRETKHRDLDRHLEWADAALSETMTIGEGLRLSLDANAHDLSQLSGAGARYEAGLSLLSAPDGLNRLNIIADNFGGEFLADLVLAVVAAEAGVRVVLHVKQMPMFVSDTTMDDVDLLLAHASNGALLRRLRKAMEKGDIRFAAHPFWSAPLFFDALPVEELGSGPGVLNVLKGDLNFRRAVGDVSVAPETPFESLPVLPAAPMLSLRSIKSYCVAGMAEWPAGLDEDEFPADGSIVAVQTIPAR